MILREVNHPLVSPQSTSPFFLVLPSVELSTLKRNYNSEYIHGAKVPSLGRVWGFGQRGVQCREALCNNTREKTG